VNQFKEKKKDGHGIYVSECYRVFVKGAQNFDEAKEIWDEAALDDERCTVVKYYEDDVWD